MRWFGHVTRMTHERLGRWILLTTLTGKQNRNRPWTMAWLPFRPGLVAFMWSQKNYHRSCWKPWGISRYRQTADPRPSREEKLTWNKMDERWLRLLLYCSLRVFQPFQFAKTEISNQNLECPESAIWKYDSKYSRLIFYFLLAPETIFWKLPPTFHQLWRIPAFPHQ